MDETTWIAGGASAGGILCLLVSLLLKQKRGVNSLGYAFLREIGVALIVATVIIVAVERVIAGHHEEQRTQLLADNEEQRKRLISDIHASTLPLALNAAVGRDVGEEIERQILTPRIQYSDFKTTGRIQLQDDVDPPSVLVDIATEFQVHNLSAETIIYLRPVQITELRGAIRSMSDTLVRIDERGRPVGKPLRDIQLTEADLRMYHTSKTEFVFSQDTVLESGASYRRTTTTSYTEDVNSDYGIRSIYPCRRMSLLLVIDKRLDVFCDFSYPRGDATNNVCSCSIDKNNIVNASVNATLLPYQGIAVSWRTKPQPGRNAPAPSRP